jgi:hypothetical protein
MEKNKSQWFRDYRNNLIKSWEENIEKHISASSDISEIENEDELKLFVKKRLNLHYSQTQISTKN